MGVTHNIIRHIWKYYLFKTGSDQLRCITEESRVVKSLANRLWLFSPTSVMKRECVCVCVCVILPSISRSCMQH
jgi:hypothetical protein